MRETLMAMFDAFLGFGKVTATKQATSTKQVLASIRGNEADAGVEERPFQVLWGHAAIVYRPPADTEVMFARIGEEMVPIASRDVRFAVELSEGEVVIRNLNADTPARVRLLASGEVVTEGGKLAAVAPGDALAVATKALALAQSVDDRLNTLRSTINTHTHTGGTISGNTGTIQTAQVLPALASVGSARVFSKD